MSHPVQATVKRQLVLATRNAGKVLELQRLLEGVDVEVLSLADFPGAPEVEETGQTFAENALLKARSAAAHTGLVALADDSGLEVDALGGRPGVYSARFAGPTATDEENNRKLLALMQGAEGKARTARFRSAVAIVSPDGRSRVVEGSCEGILLDAPRGSDGFGYDPLFLVPDLGMTFAELPVEEKNRISHRGQALRQALRELPAFWEQPTAR